MSRSDGDAPALRSGAQRMVLALGRMAPLRLTKSQWGTIARPKAADYAHQKVVTRTGAELP